MKHPRRSLQPVPQEDDSHNVYLLLRFSLTFGEARVKVRVLRHRAGQHQVNMSRM